MRKIIEVAVITFIFAAFCVPVAAQIDPVPFLHYPTVPAAIVPGGPAFTLTVNGAGFVNGAMILWNGSPRTTTYVNGTQLTATILASDIAAANLAFVNVSNPGTGGGHSNSLLFSVATPTASLAYTSAIIQGGPFNSLNIATPTDLVTAFNPPSATHFLAYSNAICPFIAGCTRNQGSIEATSSGTDIASRGLDAAPLTIAAGDFNGDGTIDLVTLGNGSGTSNPPLASGLYATVDLSTPSPFSIFGIGTPTSQLPAGASVSPHPVVADFNGDGHLDIVTGGQSAVYFVPGNGDGTFGTAISRSTESSVEGGLAAGDFNGDGIIDLAVTNSLLNTVSILIGNGDGTFKSAADYATGTNPTTVATGDFNGDGRLDLAVLDGSGATVSILMGNGDGTFKSPVEYPAALSGTSIALGDYNGDGIPDLAVLDTQCTSGSCATSGSVNVLLGNGDGTFQTQLDFAAQASPTQFATTYVSGNAPTGTAQIAVISYTQSTLSLLTPLASQSGGNPIPSVNSISPANAIAGSGSFLLTVNGGNFVSDSSVNFGGVAEPTSFVSASQLTAAIPSTGITTVGSVLVDVSTPAPGGGTSNTLSFSVLLPPPTILSLLPANVIAGSPGFTLTVNGTNFVNGSTVNINGVSRMTAFISATQITTSILSADILNVATINVSVTNPVGVDSSTGGTSSTSSLTILPANSQPTVGVLSPASTTAGGQSFILTISGTAFTPASVVTFGSMTVSSAFQNPAALQATIPANAIAIAGTPLVTVSNPGSAPSQVVTFTVNNPPPQEFSISPISVMAGSAALTLNVNGVNFNSSSTIQINGKSRSTTFVSVSLVQAALLATDLAQGSTLNVSVNNPAPGGGTTSTLPLAVADFGVTAPAPSATISAGGVAVFSLSVASSNGAYANPVTFTVTGLPTQSSASFTPSNIVTPGSSTQTVTLSVTTTAHAMSNPPFDLQEKRPILPLFSLAGILLVLAALLRRTHAARPSSSLLQLLPALLLLGFAGLAACSGGGSSALQVDPSTGTPAGTYTLTVTGTSAGASRTATVNLTVK